jgi:nicotinamide-nucleotide amidase
VGITVHRATITLRVTAEADCDEGCRALIEPTVQTIRECLGDLVFGEQGDELQHAVLRRLRARGESLATAEVGTAGRLSHWLQTASDEADDLALAETFRGGLVVPSRHSLDRLIAGDQSSLPADPAAYWQSVAQEVRTRFQADYSLVISEFPRQRSDSTADSCWIALASAQGTVAEAKDLAGHPDIVADRCAKQALDLLRAHLLPPDPFGAGRS